MLHFRGGRTLFAKESAEAAGGCRRPTKDSPVLAGRLFGSEALQYAGLRVAYTNPSKLNFVNWKFDHKLSDDFSTKIRWSLRGCCRRPAGCNVRTLESFVAARSIERTRSAWPAEGRIRRGPLLRVSSRKVSDRSAPLETLKYSEPPCTGNLVIDWRILVSSPKLFKIASL